MLIVDSYDWGCYPYRRQSSHRTKPAQAFRRTYYTDCRPKRQGQGRDFPSLPIKKVPVYHPPRSKECRGRLRPFSACSRCLSALSLIHISIWFNMVQFIQPFL